MRVNNVPLKSKLLFFVTFMHKMRISVLITVKNDLKNIEALIHSLETLDHDFEIVVVDAFSTDGTYEFLKTKNENGKIIVARKRGNRSVGRNECIRLSAGANLVFLDSDTEISETWGHDIKKDLGHKIVAGRIIQKSSSAWSELGRVPIIYEGKDVTYPSNNLMYSREVIERIGMFDERFNTAEDVDLNIRAIKSGYEIFYDNDLVVYHHPRESYHSLLKQSYYDGAGRRLIKRKHGVKSTFNRENLRKHPAIESSRLIIGMLGYLFGG
jgi:glycosyltransferase involved in cell wall biosynthesis